MSDDFGDRFRALEDVPVPDQWANIEHRTPSDDLPEPEPETGSVRSYRAATLAAVAAAAVVVVVVASSLVGDRGRSADVDTVDVPSPSTGAAVPDPPSQVGDGIAGRCAGADALHVDLDGDGTDDDAYLVFDDESQQTEVGVCTSTGVRTTIDAAAGSTQISAVRPGVDGPYLLIFGGTSASQVYERAATVVDGDVAVLDLELLTGFEPDAPTYYAWGCPTTDRALITVEVTETDTTRRTFRIEDASVVPAGTETLPPSGDGLEPLDYATSLVPSCPRLELGTEPPDRAGPEPDVLIARPGDSAKDLAERVISDVFAAPAVTVRVDDPDPLTEIVTLETPGGGTIEATIVTGPNGAKTLERVASTGFSIRESNGAFVSSPVPGRLTITGYDGQLTEPGEVMIADTPIDAGNTAGPFDLVESSWLRMDLVSDVGPAQYYLARR